MVGIVVRNDEIVDAVDVVSSQILKDVLAIIVEIARIDEHRLAGRADEQRAARLTDIDVVYLERAVRRWNLTLGVGR